MPSISTTATSLGSNPGLVQNLGPNNLYLGGSSVTASNGLEVTPGESVSVGFTNSPIYGISAGTSDVRVMGGARGIFTRTPAAE